MMSLGGAFCGIAELSGIVASAAVRWQGFVVCNFGSGILFYPRPKAEGHVGTVVVISRCRAVQLCRAVKFSQAS